MSIISLDLGGTKILGGKVSHGRIIGSANRYKLDDKITVNQQIFDMIDHFFDIKVTGIAIGIPGVVNMDKNIIINTPNISNWKYTSFAKKLEKRYKVPIKLVNDANAFALGEKHFGQGENIKNLVCITLGTGFGTGIIINNELYTGHHQGAGEFGRMIFRNSILEHYASGQFFKRKYKKSGEEMYQLAREGNKKAIKVFNQFGYHTGDALSIIARAFDPELIIIGGSIAKVYKLFEKNMRIRMKELIVRKHSKIVRSKLEHAALLGAASLF